MKELLRLAMENAKLKKKIRDLLEENAELKQGLRCAYPETVAECWELYFSEKVRDEK